MIATIGRFLCLTNPHRSRRALFVRVKQHNGNPSGRSGASSPCAESQGEISCGGAAYFSNIGVPFTGERQPLRPQRRPAPLTQGSQEALAGDTAFFSNIGVPFHGGTATPQAAATASSPYTGEPGGIHTGDPVQKRVSGGEPSGTLFFALRQWLFGYCKNTSPHPRRR